MAEIKETREIAQKWARVTPARAPDYAAGVRRPRRDWQEATAAAQERWIQAITQAAQRGAFAGGVVNAGTRTWQEETLRKGVPRWGQGVAGAARAYEEGFRPFAETIRALALPERSPTGDVRTNIERVAVIAEALRARKQELQGGGPA